MNLRHILTAAAGLLLAAAVQAHDCSGGTEGGMDATGNQCNDPATVVAAAPAPGAVKAGDQASRPAAAVRPPRSAARAANGSERLARATTPQGR
jgi:hypothetical protein